MDGEVLDQVKKQRQPSKRMDIKDILQPIADELGEDVNVIIDSLGKKVNSDPSFRVMRANNTLFMYTNMGSGMMDVVAMQSADNPRDFMNSIKEFTEAGKKSGFTRAKFLIHNPQVAKAMQMIGLKYKIEAQGIGPDGRPYMQAIVEA
jgi:hypothetical protein